MKLNLSYTVFLCLMLNINNIQSMDQEPSSTSTTYEEEDGGTITPNNSPVPNTPIETQILEIHELVQDIQEQINQEQENTTKLLAKIADSEKTIASLNQQIQTIQRQAITSVSLKHALINKMTYIRDEYLNYLNPKDKTGLSRYAQQATAITLSAAAIFIIYKILCEVKKSKDMRTQKKAKIERIMNKLMQNEAKIDRFIAQ